MYKSYGLEECCQRLLWLCWQPWLWTVVQDWANNKLKIFLCKLSTNQVHREVGDSHVWQVMECAHHGVWHCGRRKCTIVDVTSTDEKPWFSIWAFTTEVIPELYKTRNLEASIQDGKEHSFSHGLPRHCLVHECSVLQNSWGDEFLFTAWTFWIQPVVSGDLCLCNGWWLGDWLPQERVDPSPQDTL